MMLKLSEILPTLLLWMMGNSSSLHSAIIYIDLSLFRFSAFWTCCFSSLGYESSSEVQPHNSRNRVMLKIFLGSRRYILPCGIWVFSRSSKGRKEGRTDLVTWRCSFCIWNKRSESLRLFVVQSLNIDRDHESENSRKVKAFTFISLLFSLVRLSFPSVSFEEVFEGSPQ